MPYINVIYQAPWQNTGEIILWDYYSTLGLYCDHVTVVKEDWRLIVDSSFRRKLIIEITFFDLALVDDRLLMPVLESTTNCV